MSKKHTWQEYIRKTNYTMPASGTRWSGQDQWIFQNRLIRGPYTGSLLTQCPFEYLEKLRRTPNLGKLDKQSLDNHFSIINGSQPGPPVDQ